MTDAEILQSKIDHWHAWVDIVELVRNNTPSGVRVAHPVSRRKPLLFDAMTKHLRKKADEHRRR